jgi:TRAP-type C4-dicarboxylate transport system substrate-binding protein
MKRVLLILLLLALPVVGQAQQDNPLAGWAPKFDPSQAQYTYILSNVSHPAISGVAVGYHIRDRVWKETNGQIYVDYRPLSQLGGEKDVINKLKMGAIQGMLSSSVAAANIADRLGVVNLPYVIDTADKLEQFRNDPELWEPFSESTLRQRLYTLDVTSYGPYGWATTVPATTIAEAKSVTFRIAQAPVNTDFYKALGLKFTALPWPDVPQALQTGVITGLDHTATVCNLTKKFTIAKHFTELNYAQGMFIHVANKRWLDRLPDELRATFLRVITEESEKARQAARTQNAEQIAAAKAEGVTFHKLSDSDMAELKQLSEPVLQKWGKKIGSDYLQKVRTTLGS